MPLQFQNIQVVLDEGIDTKTDRKIVTQLRQAKNCTWNSPGSVKKRFGHTALDMSPMDATPITACARLASLKGELLHFDGSLVRAYSPSHAKFTNGVQTPEALIVSEPVTRNAGKDASFNDEVCCQNFPNLLVQAWRSTEAGVFYGRYRVVDALTGAVLLDEQFLNSPGAAAPIAAPIRCVTAGNYVIFLFVDAGTGALTGQTIDLSSSNMPIQAPVVIAGALAATRYFDACPIGLNRFAVTYATTVPNMRTGIITVPALTTLSDLATANTPSSPMGIAGTIGVNENLYVVYRDTASTNLRVTIFTTAPYAPDTLTLKLAPTNVAIAPGAVDSVGIAVTTASRALILWDIVPGVTPLRDVHARGVTDAGALLGIEQVYRGVRIVSKPWLYSSKVFIAVGSAPTVAASLQLTLFIIDVTDSYSGGTLGIRVVANAAQRRLKPAFSQSNTVSSPADGQFTFSACVSYLATQLAARSAVNSFTVDMSSLRRFLSAELGQELHICSGVASDFDGTNCFEMNFLQFPETVAGATLIAGGGGSMAAGTYWYSFCWASIDAAGNIHRSNPSTPISVVVGALGTVAISMPSLTLSNRAPRNGFPGVFLEAYRSTVGGTTSVMFNITSLFASGATGNYYDGSAPVTVTDSFIDSSITSLATLYTNSGQLASFPPPPCTVMCGHKNCLFVVSDEDGSIWQSKPSVVGEGISFSEALRLLLPTSDKPVALLSMDDKLVIWTSNNVFIAYGEPFDEKGASGSLTIQLVASDCGCVEPRSVCRGADGVFFLSAKGYYLLSRQMETVYAGADAEESFKSYARCAFAVLSGTTNEIRVGLRAPIAPLATPFGVVCVLNYYGKSQSNPYGKWSTFDYTSTLGDAVAAVSVGGQFYWAKATGQVYKEDRTLFTDAGLYVQQTVETGPFPLSGPQGFARFKRVGFLGESKGDHAVQIQICPDYSQVYTQSTVFSRATLSTLAFENVSVGVKNQTASAYQVIINDFQDGGILGTGEGFSLTGLVLEAAAKTGSAAKRLPAEAKG